MTMIGITFCCVEGSCYGLALRFWIIYYQTQLSSIVESQEWRKLIDSKCKIDDLGKKHGQWFVDHTKDFGNYHYCKKIFVFTGTVGAVLTTFLFLS